MENFSILGISGSHRKGSRSRLVLQRALDIAESGGVKTTLLEAYKLELPSFRGKSNHPEVLSMRSEVSRAGAIILSSPVYQECMSSTLKNFLEHLDQEDKTRQALSGKRVGLIAVSGGGGTASCLASMYASCTALGGDVVRVRVGLTEQAMDAEGVLYDPFPDERLEAMMASITRFDP